MEARVSVENIYRGLDIIRGAKALIEIEMKTAKDFGAARKNVNAALAMIDKGLEQINTSDRLNIHDIMDELDVDVSDMADLAKKAASAKGNNRLMLRPEKDYEDSYTRGINKAAVETARIELSEYGRFKEANPTSDVTLEQFSANRKAESEREARLLGAELG